MAIPTEAQKRVSAMVPENVADLLEQSAKENGRSTASELRLAIEAWLKSQGRR